MTKIAAITIDLTARQGWFEPLAGPAYPTDTIAVCPADHWKARSAAACMCGRHRGASVGFLLDLLCPTPAWLSAAAILDVAIEPLGSSVATGQPAARHAVLKGVLVPRCAACGRTVGRDTVPLLVPTPGGAARVQVGCPRHATGGTPLPLPQLSLLVGAPLDWATPSLLDELLTTPPNPLDLGRQRGPLLATRTVDDLRMGQIGFTPLAALRRDLERGLWLHLDAPAPQRPHGPAIVPVLRTVDLTYEIIATTDIAAGLDAHLAEPRTPDGRRREQPVASVRGRHRLPRYACLPDLTSTPRNAR